MKIKVNDEVLVIAGKDKGKSGKVLKTFKKDNKVLVEGINIHKRHQKANQANENGGIFDVEAPIHVSNVKNVEKKETKKKGKKD